MCFNKVFWLARGKQVASTTSQMIFQQSIHTNPRKANGKYNLAEAWTSDGALEAPGRFVSTAVKNKEIYIYI